MKKKILIFIPIIVIVFILFQLCCIHLYKGNLIFFVINEYWIDSIHVEIYVDGYRVVERHDAGIYSTYPLKAKLKKQKVVIKINGDESQEFYINTVLFTHIVVNYYGDHPIRESPFYDGGDVRFKIRIKKRPVILNLS